MKGSIIVRYIRTVYISRVVGGGEMVRY